MSIATETTYDVFLSYNQRDRGAAELVRQALSESGLEAYPAESVEIGPETVARFRQALAECSAVLFLLTSSSIRSQNVAYETGMALAWNKPIYVLFDGLDLSEVPSYLKEFEVRRLSEMDTVAHEIAAARQPLSDELKSQLIAVYRERGVPTDQLLRKPLEIKDLAGDFQERTGAAIAGERLVEELIRLRKQGQLPRLNRD